MLVLTRNPGQNFTIGKDIKIWINRVYGNKVCIAIDAPKHLAIIRDNAVKREKCESIDLNRSGG